MKIYRKKSSARCVGVVRVGILQEGHALINDHEYGNGTCIFTRDGEVARYFTDHIQVGMVGVNVPCPCPWPYHSFGGWKRSLFGDLCTPTAPDAVRFIPSARPSQRWPSAGVREGAVFSFPSRWARWSMKKRTIPRVFPWLIGGRLGPYALAAESMLYASLPENPPTQERNACPAL